MSMTKKDYQLVADTINTQLALIHSSLATELRKPLNEQDKERIRNLTDRVRTVFVTACGLANAFHSQNKLFNHRMFLSACGMEEGMHYVLYAAQEADDADDVTIVCAMLGRVVWWNLFKDEFWAC